TTCGMRCVATAAPGRYGRQAQPQPQWTCSPLLGWNGTPEPPTPLCGSWSMWTKHPTGSTRASTAAPWWHNHGSRPERQVRAGVFCTQKSPPSLITNKGARPPPGATLPLLFTAPVTVHPPLWNTLQRLHPRLFQQQLVRVLIPTVQLPRVGTV